MSTPSHHTHSQPSNKRAFHRDWRIWAAVLLMVVAMLVYVLTLDESVAPGGPPTGTQTTPAPAGN